MLLYVEFDIMAAIPVPLFKAVLVYRCVLVCLRCVGGNTRLGLASVRENLYI